MAETSKSVAKTVKKRSGDKRSFVEIASEFIGRDEEGEKAYCRIDSRSACSYVQSKVDIGNFIRHFRARHPEKSNVHGLLDHFDPAAKKPRVIAKRPVAVDKQLLIEALVKLLTFHQLPMDCLKWEGFLMILEPLASAVDGLTINPTNMKVHMAKIVEKIKQLLKEEMEHKLVSIKIDSASRFNRHILGINTQYELQGRVVVRTLAMMEVKESQTAKFLKSKIMETLQGYGVSIQQIFSVTCDNGANMLAAVRKLKEEMQLTLLTNDDNEEDDEIEQRDLTAELCAEFSERLNLVRCAVHSLQLAILDVVKRTDEMVKKVTEVAKKCKLTKYKTYFDYKNGSYPPVWCQTRWGGIFKMMESFKNQKEFFTGIAQDFPELDLTGSWQFIEHYEEAFKPAYLCTKNMQAMHVSLPDFYMAWLLAISEIQKIGNNQFSPKLVEALTNRLLNLRGSRAFKMALYLDPRFNYLGSKIFTQEEKLQIQEYIIETWNRIKELQSIPTSSQETSSSTVVANDDFDQYLTDLFGGSMPAEGSSGPSSFLQQLKTLEVEPRHSYNYDVFKHWLHRAQTHFELYRVAMVVLAVPSNQVSVERSFSALGLVLSNRRTGLGEETLTNILLVKLNKELFDAVMPVLYNWKENASSSSLATSSAQDQ